MSTTGRGRFAGAVHLALGTALLALWVSGTASVWTIGPLAAVLAWAVVRRRRGIVPSERAELLWNLVALAYLGVYALDLLVVTRDLLGASLRLLVFLSVQRTLAARTDRDRVQLLLISFLAVVASTASTTEFRFAIPLALFTAAALRALASRQLDRAGVSVRSVPSPPPTTLALWTTGVLALGTLLFFLIPHIGTGYFRPTQGLRQQFSGFSGRIELGSINRIKKNHEIVMRIRIERPPPVGLPLRWRGLGFDRYDGRGWSRSSSSLTWSSNRARGFELGPAGGGPSMTYQVTLEPMGTSALFAAATPIHLQSDDVLQVARDQEDGLHQSPRRRRRVTYRVDSELQGALRRDGSLRAAGRSYPPDILRTYLELPPMDSRILQVGSDLAGSATDPFDVAERIERGLKERYTYTLDVNDQGVADPLGRFLLEGAPGHCEYFATAMAVLCRQRGIPARVVAGFLQGEYSEIHGTYLVRQSDAHSWVEVYFPGHGWVEFDPTPPVPQVETVAWLARLRRAFEEAEIAWDTWIVGLDLSDQASILGRARQAAGSAVAGIFQRIGRGLRSMRRFAWGALALGGLAFVVLSLARRHGPDALRWLQGRWRRELRPEESDRLVALYRRFLSALRRRGVRRDVHRTPLEFARDAASQLGDGRAVEEITGLFCRARYGGTGLNRSEVRRIEELIGRLRA